MNKGTAIVGFLLCFLAGMGLMWGINKSSGPAIQAEGAHGAEQHAAIGGVDHSGAKVPVEADDPTWGNPTAPVTIVEISDYQCPFCARVEPTIEQIKNTPAYKDKIRIVWKNNPLPFHDKAKPAHEAAAAVFKVGGNEAFWKFHKLAFQNQQTLSADNFKKWATEAGVDGAKFEAELKSGRPTAKVQKDLDFGNKVGARGTPNFRINGQEVSGAQPFDEFKKVIDKELEEAEKLAKSGTPAKEIYLKRVDANFRPAPAAADKKPEAEKPEEDKSTWKIPVFADDPVKGPKDALVTVVIWSDFQCPFCSRVEKTLDEVSAAYPKDVRMVWKDNPLPFHNQAKPAAYIGRAAYAKGGSELFWKAHKALFAGQGEGLKDEQLAGIAKELGLDFEAVKKDGPKYDEKIEASQDLANDVEARGTPHFFINGRRLSGAQPLEGFKTVIDEQLAAAKALVAKGTPADKVYEEIIKNGKEPPAPPTKEPPPIGKDDAVKGAAGAKVVVHEFSDFQCPFCKRVLPSVTQLEKEFEGKVKIVWHHMPLPFHQDAPLASEATIEAQVQKGSDGFWKFHDKLFENQQNIKREDLDKYAKELGLDMAKFKEALDKRTHKARVEADVEVAKKVGVSGTPAFLIGKYFVSGAQPYGRFKKFAKMALADAK